MKLYSAAATHESETHKLMYRRSFLRLRFISRSRSRPQSRYEGVWDGKSLKGSSTCEGSYLLS